MCKTGKQSNPGSPELIRAWTGEAVRKTDQSHGSGEMMKRKQLGGLFGRRLPAIKRVMTERNESALMKKNVWSRQQQIRRARAMRRSSKSDSDIRQ